MPTTIRQSGTGPMLFRSLSSLNAPPELSPLGVGLERRRRMPLLPSASGLQGELSHNAPLKN